MNLKSVAVFLQLEIILGVLASSTNRTANTTTRSPSVNVTHGIDNTTKRSPSANGTNGIENTTKQSSTTTHVQLTDDYKGYVVDLTRGSFNDSVANGSYFVMFYDPT